MTWHIYLDWTSDSMESYKNVQYLSCLTDTLVRSDQISSQNIMSLIILQMAWALRTNMFPLSLPQSPPTKGASARMELAAWKMTHDVEWDSAWLFWWLHSAKRTKMCLFPHNEPLSQSDTQGAASEGGEADAFCAAWPVCWGDVCCLCSVRMLRNSVTAWECLTRHAAMTGSIVQCFWTKNLGLSKTL